MLCLGLNEKYDLMLVDAGNGKKDLAVFAGSDAVALHVKQRLLHHFGDWFLNKNSGVPWQETILANGRKAKYNQTISETLIKKTILDTPGVDRFTEPPVFQWDYSNTLSGRILRVLKMCILVDCRNARESIELEFSV